MGLGPGIFLADIAEYFALELFYFVDVAPYALVTDVGGPINITKLVKIHY